MCLFVEREYSCGHKNFFITKEHCAEHNPALGYMACGRPGLHERLLAGEFVVSREQYPRNRCFWCEHHADNTPFPLAFSKAEDYIATLVPSMRVAMEGILAPYMQVSDRPLGPPIISNSDLSLDEIEEKFFGPAQWRAERYPTGGEVWSGNALLKHGNGPATFSVATPPYAAGRVWTGQRPDGPRAGEYFHDGPS